MAANFGKCAILRKSCDSWILNYYVIPNCENKFFFCTILICYVILLKEMKYEND